jgi:hypothetical protein
MAYRYSCTSESGAIFGVFLKVQDYGGSIGPTNIPVCSAESEDNNVRNFWCNTAAFGIAKGSENSA